MTENKNFPKIKILVACHKADPNIRQDDIHMPIQVGKVLHPELDLGFQGDNTGDNISEKNPYYCELTALYWAWKNLPKNIEFVGLAHYRRYFDINKAEIEKIFQKYDIIAAKPVAQAASNINNLVHFIGLEDAYILIDTILDLYPDIKPQIIDYFFNNNHYSVFNMLIARKNIFNEYCSFLFKILDATEKRIKKFEGYNRQNRKIGYMGEALLGLWIQYKKPKVKYIKTFQTHAQKGTLKHELLCKIKPLLFDASFKIQNFPKTKEIYPLAAISAGLKADGIEFNHI